MSTDQDLTETKEMECPVCHDYYQEPKILPCAHTLCRHCLVTWLSSRNEAFCPLCRCAIRESSPLNRCHNKSSEDIANSLPTDLAMAGLVQSVKTLKKEQVCCAHPGISACYVCLSCHSMLCQHCASGHMTTSGAHHVTESLANLSAERLASTRPATCSKHTGEPSKFFCQSHGVLLCDHCATSKHRSCSRVAGLEEKLQEAHTLFAWFSATLRASERALERAITQLDQELAQAERRSKEAMKEMEEACDRLEEAVKSCRHRLRDLQHTKTSEAQDVILRKKDVLIEYRGKLTSHRRLVERVDRTVSCNDVQYMETTLHSLVKALSLLPDDLKDVKMTLVQIDQDAVQRVERDLNMLETLCDVKTVIPVQSGLQSHCGDQRPVLRFHGNHGKNIFLTDDRQMAEWVDRVNSIFGHHGIVIGSDPLFTDLLYEVEVGQPGYMLVGVSVEHPATLCLPDDALDWKSAVVVGRHIVSDRGHTIKTQIGKPLKKLKIGSRVGVLIDSTKGLHLYIDGQDQGVAARDVPQPCYPLFQLYLSGVGEITALPVTSVA